MGRSPLLQFDMAAFQEFQDTVGGGSVRRSEVDTIEGRSPLLQFDMAAFQEFQDTL